MFFFGDYQGTPQHRWRLAAADACRPRRRARGDLSAYGVNIYDPATGAPARAQQFAEQRHPGGTAVAAGAGASCALIPLPNAAGPRQRHARQLRRVRTRRRSTRTRSTSASTAGSATARTRSAATAAASSCATARRRSAPGGGQELVSLGGVSDVKNQSLAYGIDNAFSTSLLADFRFGLFRYNVNVLPFDFGTTPAADAGIPGPQPRQHVHARACPPATSIGTATAASSSARASTPTAATARSSRTRSSCSSSATSPSWSAATPSRPASTCGAPTTCACRAIAHRSGELTFSHEPHARAAGGGLGLATFLLGDVTSFGRYVSPSTDARERQWRHFYYAQDTWRASPKLTLNYGLRLDVINPQTVNEAGNGGFLDLEHRRDPGRRRRRHRPERQRREHAELGAAPRRDLSADQKTVLRAGFGRSYDIGVFGSLFGHSVTQNLPVLSVQNINAPNNFDARVQPGAGAAGAGLPDGAGRTAGSRCRTASSRARCRRSSGRRPSDAWNVTVQHQLTDTMSVEAAYVGNRGAHVFAGDGPAANVNQPTLVGFAEGVRPTCGGRSSPATSPTTRASAARSAGRRASTTSATAPPTPTTRCRPRRPSASAAATRCSRSTRCSTRENNDGDYFFIDPRREPRHRRTWIARTPSRVSPVAELPVGRGQAFLSDVSPAVDAIVGGWQFNKNTMIQSGLPFNVTYRNAGAGPRHRAEPART